MDLDIQGNNFNMERFNYIVLIVSAGFLFACSGVQKTVKTEADAQVKTEATQLAEEKKNEFEYLFIEALKQKTIGDLKKSVSLLSSCLEIDPASSAAMYELANIHAANNDLTSASMLIEKAISINPGNKWYNLSLATIYQRLKKFEDAARVYQKLLTADPDNIEYLFLAARLLEEAKKYEEAIKAYNQLEIKVGINEQISVARQQLYLEMGKSKEAFTEIRKLIDFNPEESKYYGLLADLYLNQGDKVNALKYYHKILEMDPENGFVHFSLANYFQETGDTIKSYEQSRLGFAAPRVDIETKLQLYFMLTSDSAEVTITDTQQEELIEVLKKANPDEFLVYTLSAERFIRKEQPEKARGELLNALAINQGDYMLWERVLFIDNDLQDWQGLYEHSRKVIDLFPNQPQVFFLNAIACFQMEKYDETVKISEEGLDMVVDNPQLKGQLMMIKGEAKYKQGLKSPAYQLFDEALKQDPENYMAMNNYAYYLSLDSTDLEKAEMMSGKVIEKFPENSTYLDTYAWVLFKRKNYTLAKFYMENALSNGGNDNSTLLEHMGDIMFMMDKKTEAIDYWQKAKRNGGQSELLDIKIRDRNYYDK